MWNRRRVLFWVWVIAGIVVLGSGWEMSGGTRMLAVRTAPIKARSATVTAESKAANALFWDVLHGGRYDEIPHVLDALTAVYINDPGDAETAAHIGFAHIWKVAERARLSDPSPTIIDDLVLARKYFEEAVHLVPGDARFRGFLASAELGEASVHHDEKLTRKGYFDLMDAKDAFPEFNLFTAGYVLSDLPVNDPKFHDAVEYQWQSVDLVADKSYDRKTVSLKNNMHKETHVGPKRVLWNSTIAPHNWEGFFLNMGDMIVKQGDVETARSVYANARLSKAYAAWPFRDVLEARIAQAAENVAIFRKPPPRGESTRAIMFRSGFSCMGCHQK